MPKNKNQNKSTGLAHIVSKDAEHDRHGGIFALCGTYIAAGYERNPSAGRPGCIGCLTQNTDNLVNALGDVHNAFVEGVTGVIKEVEHQINEGLRHERQVWMEAHDRLSLRVEHLEQRLDKADAKKAKKETKR